MSNHIRSMIDVKIIKQYLIENNPDFINTSMLITKDNVLDYKNKYSSNTTEYKLLDSMMTGELKNNS